MQAALETAHGDQAVGSVQVQPMQGIHDHPGLSGPHVPAGC